MFGMRLGKMGSVGALALDPAAAAVIARMTTPPTSARQTAINNLVVSLKAAGVWSKLDSFQVYAAHNAQAALLDWINAARTVSATADFTADLGYISNTNKTVNMGFKPNDSGLLYGLNAGAFGFFSTTDEATGGSVMGAWDTVNGATIGVKNNTDFNGSFRPNTGTAVVMGPSFGGNGLWTVSRTASNLTKVYQNNVERASTTVAPVGLANANFFVGGLAASGVAPAKTFQAAFVGAGLTISEVAAINTAVRAYLIAIGISVSP